MLYIMLCYVMLCYVMLCYVMLCYVMLCYVMLLCSFSCVMPRRLNFRADISEGPSLSSFRPH